MAGTCPAMTVENMSMAFGLGDWAEILSWPAVLQSWLRGLRPVMIAAKALEKHQRPVLDALAWWRVIRRLRIVERAMRRKACRA